MSAKIKAAAFLIFLALCIVFPSGVAATALGDLVASMQPGAWRPLKNNLTFEMLHGGYVSDITINYANSIDWEPNSQTLFYSGSPHGGPNKTFVYSATADNWREIQCPLASSCHSYDMRTVVPDSGFFWVHYCANSSNTILRYYPVDDRWDTLNTVGLPTPFADPAVWADAYFPEMQSIICYSGASGIVWKLYLPTRTWSNLGNIGMGWNTLAEYNPVYKIVGLSRGDLGGIYQLDTNGTLSILTTPPIAAGIGTSHLSVDPVSGDYLLISPTAFYAFNMDSLKWRPVPFNPTSLGTTLSLISPMHMIFGAISTYGCNVLVNTTSYSVLIYKHTGVASAEKNAGGYRKGLDLQCLPNPFNPTATLSFRLPGAGNVLLQVYDAGGRLVNTVWKGRAPAGETRVALNAVGLPSGVYVARLSAQGLTLNLRLALMK